MSEQPPRPAAPAPKKAWYLRWWVWLIAGFVLIGGIGAIVNPKHDLDSAGPAWPSTSWSAAPTPSATPTALASFDLAGYLTGAGVAFKSANLSAGKAVIYVPTETTSAQAQQIAGDAMQYMCDYAKQAGESYPRANRVEVSDGVSIATPGYNAADHPSGFATSSACK